MSHDLPALLDLPPEFAEFLGVPRKTLYQWRQQGYGSPGRRVGRYVWYDQREVREWFASLSGDVA